MGWVRLSPYAIVIVYLWSWGMGLATGTEVGFNFGKVKFVNFVYFFIVLVY